MEAILDQHRQTLLDVFTDIKHHQTSLASLNTWWDKVSLIGKINSLNVPQSLLASMLDTKAEFTELQERLIENLLFEHMQHGYQDAHARAQVLVDIPIRNLFERTADVGFLATDQDIRGYLSQTAPGDAQRQAIQARLREYALKYTVYNDILLLRPDGRVVAGLDETNTVTHSQDPILSLVVGGQQAYTEVYRKSDLRPMQASASLFFAPIYASQNQRQVIGILVMSFDLQDEMTLLFGQLTQANDPAILCLLDSKNRVIASNRPTVLPIDTPVSVTTANQLISVKDRLYLVVCRPTRGYQGYQGLGWQGCVLLPLSASTAMETEKSQLDPRLLSQWKGFSQSLTSIQRNAAIVTADLDLVVLNGRIASARRNADEFIPILEEVRNIGRSMQSIFSQSVSNLMQTALNTHFQELEFQARLATDIMDRNLYERANDCRWWALTSAFAESLSKPALSQSDAQNLAKILAYINGLYTVYTNLMVYDAQGTILAVSEPGQQHWVGRKLEDYSGFERVAKLTTTQQYAVSSFRDTEYYHHQHTYLYHAAIRQGQKLLGGIALVFDSEPQFRQMLDEVLPDDTQSRFALYVERSGKVIAGSAKAPWKVGHKLKLPEFLSQASCGASGARLSSLEGQGYTVGYSVSSGYREYKTTDGYRNDVIALVLVANGELAKSEPAVIPIR